MRIYNREVVYYGELGFYCVDCAECGETRLFEVDIYIVDNYVYIYSIDLGLNVNCVKKN